MPQRFLRPGLTTSQRYNCCSIGAQNLFIRLITLVDDHGRYDAELMLLRSHAFPFGDPQGKDIPLKTLAEWCSELARAALCLFYRDEEGKQYLQLSRWQERVRSASRYPDPSDNKCSHVADICSQRDNKCSPPKPLAISHKPLAISHSTNGSAEQNTSAPADLEKAWRETIAADPAYSHIRVSDEFGKMLRWCEVNKKQPTRRRFIYWLNRIEKPFKAFPGIRKSGAAKQAAPLTTTEYSDSPAKSAERQRLMREVSDKLSQQMSTTEVGGQM